MDYGYQHGIAVIPEIESLGHSTAKGFHYPDLVSGGFEQHYEGIGPHIRKSHLNPHDPRSYELLASIYDEWFPLLPSPLGAPGPGRGAAARRSRRASGASLAAGGPGGSPAWRQDYAYRLGGRAGDARRMQGAGDPLSVGLCRGFGELGERAFAKAGHGRAFVAGCQEQVFMAGGSGALHQPYTKSDYEEAFENLADWARWGADAPTLPGCSRCNGPATCSMTGCPISSPRRTMAGSRPTRAGL